MLEMKYELLKERADAVPGLLEDCRACPRNCGVNRLKNERGFCKSGARPVIYAHQAHYGEEPPLSGRAGSGAIFFSNCNLRCSYCQNFKFSQLGEGRELSCEELAYIMLELQKAGCHNINLVTPTHFAPQIIQSLFIAIGKGLSIPIVYNTSGYEVLETLKLLEGIVDIYLPDMRYGDDDAAYRYSQAKGYVGVNRASVCEMYRQVGNLALDDNGVAKRGMIIRHLVLPSRLSGTGKVFKFIKDELSADMYISLMSQYVPLYKAHLDSMICRSITKDEYNEAVGLLELYGLHNGWVQDYMEVDYQSGYLGTNLVAR